MKITKYIHACIFLDKDGKRLVIDPGEYTELPEDISNIGVIFLTHVHADHVGVENIKKIVAANPGVKIYGLEDALSTLKDLDAELIAIKGTGVTEAGGYSIKYFAHDHAIIYESVPCQNLGVLIDNALYYPGDSYHLIEDKVEVVAVPISGPWSKTSDAIDFSKAMKSKRFFGTHDAHASERGQESQGTWISRFFGEDKKWESLKVGESLQT